jgi:hypothetical protein
MNFKEIVTAWITSLNPNDAEKTRSIERASICIKCEYKKEIFDNKEWSTICGKCGCPLSKKVFSQEYNPCPIKRWEEVDIKYPHLYKNKKSIF